MTILSSIKEQSEQWSEAKLLLTTPKTDCCALTLVTRKVVESEWHSEEAHISTKISHLQYRIWTKDFLVHWVVVYVEMISYHIIYGKVGKAIQFASCPLRQGLCHFSFVACICHFISLVLICASSNTQWLTKDFPITWSAYPWLTCILKLIPSLNHTFSSISNE